MTLPVGRKKQLAAKAFTAIEITAVATIIAILALLILPLLRGRVESARLTSAQDDLAQLAKGEQLAQADTGHYFRLQDLDNTKYLDPAKMLDQITVAVPHAYWNVTLTAIDNHTNASAGAERKKLAERWTGPYCAIRRTATLADALAETPYLFWWAGGTGGGPILVTELDVPAEEQLPIDPWGNPYIFFGPGKFMDPAASDPAKPPPGLSVPPAIQGAESDFGNCVIYCTGPDGRPGDAADLLNPTSPLNYFRERGILGALGSDDMQIAF